MPRTSKSKKEATHDRILDVAARAIRRNGYSGTGVAAVMKEAGLTHGGFYGHFASKEDLMAEACERALMHSGERWHQRAESDPCDPIGALARGYLTAKHRDNPGSGCLIAAVGSDAARHGPGVRHAITEWLRFSFDFVARWMPGRSAAARRQKAITAYASWVGAMVLARAVDDKRLSQEILDSVLACTSKPT